MQITPLNQYTVTASRFVHKWAYELLKKVAISFSLGELPMTIFWPGKFLSQILKRRLRGSLWKAQGSLGDRD